MQTRRCSSCDQEKTIRGIWFMLPPEGVGRAFVCETCMVRKPAIAA